MTETRRGLEKAKKNLDKKTDLLNDRIAEEVAYLSDWASCRADIRINAGILRWSPSEKTLIIIDDKSSLELKHRRLKTRMEAVKNFDRLEGEGRERMATMQASVTRTLNAAGSRKAAA